MGLDREGGRCRHGAEGLVGEGLHTNDLLPADPRDRRRHEEASWTRGAVSTSTLTLTQALGPSVCPPQYPRQYREIMEIEDNEEEVLEVSVDAAAQTDPFLVLPRYVHSPFSLLSLSVSPRKGPAGIGGWGDSLQGVLLGAVSRGR